MPTIFAKILKLLLCLTHFIECPDGLLCNSTIPSHYKRYSHFLLAASRAGDYLVNSLSNTLERKVTCSAAPKLSCSSGQVEQISQSEKPSKNIKNIPNDDCTLRVQNSPQMKSLNLISENTSSFAHVQMPQETFQHTETTDNSCDFEFYDFISAQESGTEDLCSEKDTSQLSLLQSKADFSECEISYSPLSTFEESEEETEEEKVKISQKKLFRDCNSEDEDCNSVMFKTFDGLLLQQKPQYEHTRPGHSIIKNKHCEEVKPLDHLDHGVKTVSQSHRNRKFCNSTCVDNQHQQEALASGSSSPFNWEEAEEPELISSAAKSGDTESEDTGACALDSAYLSFTETSSLLAREGARSLLTQNSNALREPSNILTNADKMPSNAVEKTACQESLQSVVEKEGNFNTAAVCFPSPNSKTVTSLSLASTNAKSSPAKELKQMDIGVFFGLKPKVKEESKEEMCLSEGKQISSSVTPNGKRPRQEKRKAQGSVEDVETVTESSTKNGAFAGVSSGGQQRWNKKFKVLSTAGEGTRKKHCPFYKKIPGERELLLFAEVNFGLSVGLVFFLNLDFNILHSS